MGKNIVICCDGTGNEVGTRVHSNVAKLYRSLDRSEQSKQIAYYDPGVGTIGAPGFQTKPLKFMTRMMGLAFAYGLHDNIKSAYAYLMRTYEPGDRVFLYGFSRGAYTVRALVGLIGECGLLHRNSDNLIDYAIKLHRAANFKATGTFKAYFSRECPIHFVGVWDTVKSVGLFRRSLSLPGTSKMEDVSYGRHAVSLNEKRSKYRPNLWTPPNGDKFAQVWFAGVHSDVGGGYAETELSDIALEWMLKESESCELILNPASRPTTKPDPLGTMHNPLLPYWWVLGWYRRTPVPRFWRKKKRTVWAHESVRIRRQQSSKFDTFCQRLLPPDVQYVS